MVEVFKTNVEQLEQAKVLVETLLAYFPESCINFDLEDCDKILRIESPQIIPEKIVDVMEKSGFRCEVLL